MYIQAQNRALNAFTGLTRTDFVVVHELAMLNYPVAYMTLYTAICADYAVISRTAYHEALDKLLSCGHITKQAVGNNTIYALTAQGRQLLEQYNYRLDSIVKDVITKYGNGLFSH